MKGILLSSLILAVILIVVSIVIAGEDLYELSDDVYNVATDIGHINLTKSMFIGGSPEKHIKLTENRTMPTTAGNITFLNGTEIDCDPPPGHPNPCYPD